MKTLYLYGAPGSGKTTCAKRLARESGRMYRDLDEEIVRKTGLPISEFFARHGEAEFRRIESETLREVSAPIVALGGGTLLDPENRAYCEANGFVTVLDVDAETIAARVAAAGGTRPLGNRLEERRAHYASFAHHADADTKILLPRPLRGEIRVPPSKSHEHRVLIAEFLADVRTFPEEAWDCADIAATKRCLAALADAVRAHEGSVVLDVGESGSTLRFLAPVCAALGLRPRWIRRGRLAERPMIEYDTLEAGVHELRGDVSSQFVTGLLFALPLLKGDSEIRFSTPLQSRGYVDLTLRVVRTYGIEVDERDGSFFVKGGQRFVSPGKVEIEGDWSAAAFWFAANALGSEIRVTGLNSGSNQPDAVVEDLIAQIGPSPAVIDVSPCPDLYPALAVVAAVRGKGRVEFVGTERLKIKESDRLAAMAEVLADPTDVDAKNDHRIAMAAAVLSTVSDSPVLVHGASCVAKSYPRFWDEFRMDLYAVTGWPLVKTRSPEIHNAAYAAAGRKAEMVSYPAETIDEALEFAARCGVKGMAVTIPHKLAVMARLDAVDSAAQAIGAVNTVVFRDGKAYGYNTDADGFAEAVSKYAFKRVALLGAGGAAKAVKVALERMGADVEVFHRRPLTPGFDLIVNATPVDPVPEYEFAGTEIVYDLRYVPAETPLMARARAAGCVVENGFSMLEAQAKRQRELFFGKE